MLRHQHDRHYYCSLLNTRTKSGTPTIIRGSEGGYDSAIKLGGNIETVFVIYINKTIINFKVTVAVCNDEVVTSDFNRTNNWICRTPDKLSIHNEHPEESPTYYYILNQAGRPRGVSGYPRAWYIL